MPKTLRARVNIGSVRGGRGRSVFDSYADYVELTRASTAMIQAKLLAILDQFDEISEPIMLEALQPTFEKSQVYCPVDTGRMKKSGYLMAVGKPGKPKVEIGYARNGYPDYTVYVHEMVGTPHNPPTRAKWLQSAVMEDLGAIYQHLGVEYKRFFR